MVLYADVQDIIAVKHSSVRYNHDVPRMVEWLRKTNGNITDPLDVILTNTKLVVINGVRRLLACQFVQANKDQFSVDLIKNTQRIPIRILRINVSV